MTQIHYQNLGSSIKDKLSNIPIEIIGLGIDNRKLKIWFGTTTVQDKGLWSVSYADANFTKVLSVQVSIEGDSGGDGDKPLGINIRSKDILQASGRAYKATSAGLLTAMISVPLGAGGTVHVMAIGY